MWCRTVHYIIGAVGVRVKCCAAVTSYHYLSCLTWITCITAVKYLLLNDVNSWDTGTIFFTSVNRNYEACTTHHIFNVDLKNHDEYQPSHILH